MRKLLLFLATALTLHAADLPPLPEVKPLGKDEITKALTRGVDYLVSSQNKNGSWGSATRTKGLNIYAPVPEAHHAFRAGTSGLALAGLIDSGDRRPATKAAIAKAEKWFFSELPRLRQIQPRACYAVWGHAYGLRALAALHRYHEGNPARQSELKALAETQVEALKKIEQHDGGWGYLDLDDLKTKKPSGISCGFTTATCLLAIHEAHTTLGSSLPEKEVQRGLRSIEQHRTADWQFVYSLGHRYRPRAGINRPRGSLGRSPACGTTLHKYGDKRVTNELIKSWLHQLCVHEGWFDVARKRPVPHESHYSISGYFYYYGFYYATECLLLLPEKERSPYIPILARHILEKQEKDGSWWDYPLYAYHQPYGTGYALTILSRLNASQSATDEKSLP